MIANMNLGLIEVDLHETIQFANQSFCDMSGYQLHELIGQNSKIFLHEDSISIIHSKIEIRNLGQSDAYEMKMKNKHGEIKWWLISGAPRFNDKGEMIGSIGIHLDITEQKLMEQDLIDAREMAEHSAKAKEIFLANMSHEIRTPMNAIMGMSKQLQKTTLNEKQKSFLNIINTASENLLVVINDVLDISKIEAGKLTIETIGYNLKDVVQRTINVMSHKAEEKGLSITLSFDEKIEKVLMGDPYRMNQVLLNLLSNAVKFTDKGFVKIECSLIGQVKNKFQNVCIKVIDSGIGMDENFQKNLFQKFVQEDKTVARKYGGTGLGMTICKQLIELMHGNIYVESQKHKGTSITLNVAFEIGSSTDIKNETQVLTNTDVLIGKSILLVEDNEMNRLVACEALSHYQVHITEAENGLAAIEWLKKRPFDLILMDVQMPELDGLEATAIIRNELKNNTPIIALTANAIKGESDKCIDAGMNDFISKPFEEEDLVKIMSKWLTLLHTKTLTTNTNTALLYNLDNLKKTSRGNHSFVQKMIHLFIAQTPQYIDTIQNAYLQQNFELLKTTAHKIKPVIDNLGIADLHDDIRLIEQLAESNDDNSELPLLIEKVCFTLAETVEQLKEINIVATA
jgi:PAS domain S-box-containing protein